MVEPAKLIGLLMAWVQNTRSAIPFTLGVGLTVMLNCIGTPMHVLENGVTIICAVMDVLKLFAAVNAVIFPIPDAGKPMEVLLLFH